VQVFVDYANVHRADRSRGLVYVVDKAIDALGFAHLQSESRVSFRLYDGWYLNRTPTRHAQTVAAELLANFPFTRTVTDGTKNTKIIINAELAYSLKIDPATHLWHTFRQRGYPTGLSCHHPAVVGCNESVCSLVAMHTFISTQRCPLPTCGISPGQVLHKNEQKLVDTMLAADLMYLHLQKEPKVAIVSSDDDMWPAIKTVLDLGMTILHIHTLPGHRTPAFYSRGPRPCYTELSL
jgi:uncharacterized LabA/DUF88 family protein